MSKLSFVNKSIQLRLKENKFYQKFKKYTLTLSIKSVQKRFRIKLRLIV